MFILLIFMLFINALYILLNYLRQQCMFNLDNSEGKGCEFTAINVVYLRKKKSCRNVP